jgi:hypothetical protein
MKIMFNYYFLMKEMIKENNQIILIIIMISLKRIKNIMWIIK